MNRLLLLVSIVVMMPGCMSPDMIEEMEKQRKEQRERDAKAQELTSDSAPAQGDGSPYS